MPRFRYLIVPLIAFSLQGCLAKTALGVVTAPVKVASQAADWATTSQDEADRNRGRELRRREQRLAEMQSDYEKLERKCLDGDNGACRDAIALRAEINAALPSIPVERES